MNEMKLNPIITHLTDIDFYKEKHLHPTQKPLKLIRRLIEASSNEGDVVLDPFSGAGSTQISSIQLNRHYIGIELDEKYYKIGLQRIKEEKERFSLFDSVPSDEQI